MDTVKTFFDGDLSEAEAEALDQALGQDPGLAQALLEEAQRRYRDSGLPEPSWKERRGRKWAGWASGLLLGLGGLAAWSLGGQGQPVQIVGSQAMDLPLREQESQRRVQGPAPVLEAVPLAPMAPKALVAPELPLSPGASRQGRRLGVVVRLKQEGPVTAVVQSAEGRVIALLFEGFLPAGERRFEWDGTQQDGQAVAMGEYRVVVRSQAGVQEGVLRLRGGSD